MKTISIDGFVSEQPRIEVHYGEPMENALVSVTFNENRENIELLKTMCKYILANIDNISKDIPFTMI